MNKPINRRKILKNAGVGVAAAALPLSIARAAKPKVVVVGGGPGGATAAHYIAKDSKGAIDVTLVEPNKAYTTCFFSNWYIGGFRNFESITHSYSGLADIGINIVHQMATGIDPDEKTLTLADGAKLPYDRLILAPGIDFKYGEIDGYGPDATQIMPHAYKAGPQTVLLHDQLHAMKDGGLFIMVAPPNPYRCPPGPYERISMVAHYLKNNKPKSKILILDPKGKFSKMALFQEAWGRYYDGMIEWLPREMLSGGVNAVHTASMSVKTPDEEFKGDVVNVIPPQTAGKIARDTGLADVTGWCPIVPATMESKLVADIHLVGDSTIAGDMPKSGFSANSQAKACAMAIRHALIDSRAFPPRFANTCWSLLAPSDAVKVGASYQATEEKIAKIDGFISKTGESGTLRADNAKEAVGWYSGITADMFG
ncbi:NAD(P)/FAD-dependent oxidoreductase [Hwanghaeella grinnelliae]|uniref:NAD(P)/FAD-dependent oxidoreductase n=1 Tax=Hwanghaeella grinnelliae TaxID=2500179 RepID=A0A3S2WTK5_9PROT|nr:NAD(P)/FAD-dependent oxidoreductase [Hwanghaeella grinnelliae]RVU38166.1 NAD(P)/FAD-dependent oxidoreductase [Hwanghaeella grinnelliae]